MIEPRDSLTERDAAAAWARTFNTLDAVHVALLLADDVQYRSQWVFSEMDGRAELVAWLVSKLKAIRKSGSVIRAELAETRRYPGYGFDPQPCVVLEQDGVCEVTVLFEVEGGHITRIHTCMIPPPHTCARSGEFPGLGSTLQQPAGGEA